MNDAPSNSPRSAEAGSAYVIALLVLVVLSILGLSLSLITQSEMQIGANELTTHRALYGAEGGLNLAISRVLTVDSSVGAVDLPAIEPMDFLVPESRFIYDGSGNPVSFVPADGQMHTAEQVTVSPFVPLRAAPCDGCQSIIGDVSLSSVTHAVVANAERLSWNGSDTPDQATLDDATRSAQKQLYVMVTLTNWWPPKWESIADDAQVARVVQETMGQGQN